MKPDFLKKTFAFAGATALAVLLAGCEVPPQESTQNGPAGTGMAQVKSPEREAAKLASVQIPEPQPEADAGGQKASEVYQNVKVLGHLSEGQFIRVMAAVTEWIYPEQGCAGCHNLENLAEDSVYTKVVARRMFQMTQTINSKWTAHVGGTGVTCYTCHRGAPVPANIWFKSPEPDNPPYMGARNGQNAPVRTVAYSTLPNEPFSALLMQKGQIRVQGPTAIPPRGDRMESGVPIQDAEATYGLMIHMSEGLGVNCTFCHNSRAFGSWAESPPQRVSAWHGIQMVRDLNTTYLDPLQPVYPPNRLGEAGDAPKAYCSTCHAGVNKPLHGAAMFKDYKIELSPPKAN
jgi:photosynthetic reaction center cytochrome c subunit